MAGATTSRSRIQEVSLVEDFTAVVHHGHNTIEIRPDGTVLKNGVALAPATAATGPANDAVAPGAAELRFGQQMPDGTRYAGLSDTGKPMFAAEKDAPLTMRWRKAMEYAAGLDAHGHDDWRVPTKAELNQLFQRRAEIGGFEADFYWTSTESSSVLAWYQAFSNGNHYYNSKNNNSYVRCVRDELNHSLI